MIDDLPPASGLWVFILAAITFRLATLARSKANEKALRLAGATEVGAGNSAALTIGHVLIYLAATAEGVLRGLRVDFLGITGVVVYVFGAIALVVVMQGLGRLWTVKVFLARDHKLVRTPLFRAVRHPNYYLAILPELIGLMLALHALVTLALAIPFYGALLARRIRLEERAMRERFADY